jgi:hypothetical protein
MVRFLVFNRRFFTDELVLVLKSVESRFQPSIISKVGACMLHQET